MSEQQDDGARATRRSRSRTRSPSRRPSAGRPTSCWITAPPASSAPMRHSAAHVMAEAVLDLFPGTKLGIGPAIDDGFYYDFQLPRPLTPDDLPAIEARMRESIAADHPFELQRAVAGRGARLRGRARPAVQGRDPRRPRWPRPSATARAMPPTTFYRQGPFIDLCRGPHVASTGKIGPFKLLGIAGAYWRGDEKRPMLQRVYGTAWATQEELDALPVAPRGGEEARPPPARRPARPVQLPRRRAGLGLLASQGPASSGGRSKAAMRELQARRGYQEVSTPIVVVERLWRQSGHWDLYDENMFIVESEDQTFSLKPMNCPEIDVHLPLAAAVVPRPAAALQRVRPAPPQRALRHAERA